MNIENDDTKPYKIKRGVKHNYSNEGNIVSYADNKEIRVFVLYHESDRKQVMCMEKELGNKKISFTNGVEETELAFEEKVDIINNFDYFVVIISEEIFSDLDLLDILESNYTDKNEKLIPIIVDKSLYESESKSNIIKALRERTKKFKEERFDDDFTGIEASELKKMQKILKFLQDFIEFVTKRDRKKNLRPSKKIIQYIEYHRKEKVPEKRKEETRENSVSNNFNIGNVEHLNVANHIKMT